MKNLSKLERVSLKEAWKNEANDFTPWLAKPENLTSLSDSLGIGELELVATEHLVGDFRLDILCTDGDGQVIIENQLEKTDHMHLGQIITYAAGIGAKKVIWIAESFRPEHVAALEFLNQNTTGDLNFFAAKVKLWRIGDSPLAPQFEVVVKSDEATKSAREQVAALTFTPVKQRYLKFWSALFEQIASRAPNIRPQKPQPQQGQNISIGRAGFGLVTTVSQRDNRLGVEIHINHPESKDQFKNLYSQKDAIASQLGFELNWQELPDVHRCRISVWRNNSPLDDEGQWNTYIDWFIDHIVKMNEVFRPIIRELP